MDDEGHHRVVRTGEPPIARISAAEVLARSPAVAYVSRYGGAAIWVSPRCEEIFGVSAQEWIDDPEIWTEHLHPDDRERVLASTDEGAERGGRFCMEYRVVRPDGEVVWVLDLADFVPDPKGGSGFWHGVLFPIGDWKARETFLMEHNELLEAEVGMRLEQLRETNAFLEIEVAERRRATQDLEAREAIIHELIEPHLMVVYEYDVEAGLRIISSPRAHASWTRDLDSLAQAAGADWLRFVHPDDRARMEETVRESDRLGRGFEATYRWVSGDGTLLHVAVRARPIAWSADGTTRRVLGVLTDVTEGGPRPT